MPKYKVYTEWTGYSAITVEASNEQEAEAKMYCGEYNSEDALHTGNGLDYGYDHEEVIEIREISS